MIRYLKAFLSLGIGFGDILGLVGPALGIAKGAKDLAGNAGTKAYVPKGLGAADTTFQNVLQQLAGGSSGAASAITPQLAAAFQAMLGIPTSGLTGAGAQAGQMYGALAPQAQQAGQYLTNQGMDVGNAGRQVWQTSLDPQNELRNMLQQQVVDASRAGTSARGIGMGGESAGIENKAVNDFLLNWNNQQLQRQLAGLGGYAGASNQAGRDIAGGLGAGQLGADYSLQSGQVPFQTSAAAAGFPFQAAGMYNTALGGTNQNLGGVLSAIIPYLNQGQGATQQGYFQGQVGLNNLTTGLGKAGDWLANAFGGGGGGGNSIDDSWYGNVGQGGGGYAFGGG